MELQVQLTQVVEVVEPMAQALAVLVDLALLLFPTMLSRSLFLLQVRLGLSRTTGITPTTLLLQSVQEVAVLQRLTPLRLDQVVVVELIPSRTMSH
jgi:hypothetical protein